ncbi:astacin [Cooperia oncophora]
MTQLSLRIDLVELFVFTFSSIICSKQRDEDDGFRHKRQIKKSTHLWNASKVFYELDPSLAKHDRDVVRVAMSYIRARTCVDFYEDSTATSRIRIFKGEGCWSEPGMKGRMQNLSLGKGCDSVSIV